MSLIRLFRYERRSPLRCLMFLRSPRPPPQLPQRPQPYRNFHATSSPLFSDRLLGHSPMAPPSPSSLNTATAPSGGAIPTAQDATTFGGVWAPTSAKRDKLTELQAVIAAAPPVGEEPAPIRKETVSTHRTLDDLATPAERHDLDLCDGIAAVAAAADAYPIDGPFVTTTTTEQDGTAVFQQIQESLHEAVAKARGNTDDDTNHLPRVTWEARLHAYKRQLEIELGRVPSDRYWVHVRDFLDLQTLNHVSRTPKFELPMPPHLPTAVQSPPSADSPDGESPTDAHKDEANTTASGSPVSNDDDNSALFVLTPPADGAESSPPAEFEEVWEKCVLRYRLLLTRAAVTTLLASWDKLTTVTDQDKDRAAAAAGSNAPPGSPLSLPTPETMDWTKTRTFIDAHLTGTCFDRVDALWNLRDRDEDGRLDEPEMETVCEIVLQPVQLALEQTLEEAMQASLVRPPHLLQRNKNNSAAQSTPPVNGAAALKSLSWRQRRREQRERRQLTKLLQKTLKTHFVDEVEMAHRLRCIYAWAPKAHQHNRLEAIHVEESADDAFGFGWSSWGGSSGGGRRRYVELAPKISLEEFRQVQQEHFTHLDRVGAEFMKSFREELWIQQGSKRQQDELVRDSMLFMTAVFGADFFISVF